MQNRLNTKSDEPKCPVEIFDCNPSFLRLSSSSYGSPRIAKELHAMGISASKPLVSRLIRAAGIQARRRKKFVATTDSKHNYPIAPNVLDRKFSATRPGEVWVSDITYVRTYQGWLYLTVIINPFDRKVVGWAIPGI